MLDRIQTSTARDRSHGRAVLGLVILIVAQLLLGAAMHHHVLGDHGGDAGGAIHGDFTHEWHADQHGMVPDGLVPDTATDLPPILLIGALIIVAVPALARRSTRPRERHGGPSPPRYCLPQPRDPPYLRLT